VLFGRDLADESSLLGPGSGFRLASIAGGDVSLDQGVSKGDPQPAAAASSQKGFWTSIQLPRPPRRGLVAAAAPLALRARSNEAFTVTSRLGGPPGPVFLFRVEQQALLLSSWQAPRFRLSKPLPRTFRSALAQLAIGEAGQDPRHTLADRGLSRPERWGRKNTAERMLETMNAAKRRWMAGGKRGRNGLGDDGCLQSD